MFKTYPVTSSFMLISILGFLVSAFYIYKWSISWSFTLMLFFLIMIIASLVSMTNAPIRDEAVLKDLAVHDQIHGRKKK